MSDVKQDSLFKRIALDIWPLLFSLLIIYGLYELFSRFEVESLHAVFIVSTDWIIVLLVLRSCSLWKLVEVISHQSQILGQLFIPVGLAIAIVTLQLDASSNYFGRESDAIATLGQPTAPSAAKREAFSFLLSASTVDGVTIDGCSDGGVEQAGPAALQVVHALDMRLASINWPYRKVLKFIRNSRGNPVGQSSNGTPFMGQFLTIKNLDMSCVELRDALVDQVSFKDSRWTQVRFAPNLSDPSIAMQFLDGRFDNVTFEFLTESDGKKIHFVTSKFNNVHFDNIDPRRLVFDSIADGSRSQITILPAVDNDLRNGANDTWDPVALALYQSVNPAPTCQAPKYLKSLIRKLDDGQAFIADDPRAQFSYARSETVAYVIIADLACAPVTAVGAGL